MCGQFHLSQDSSNRIRSKYHYYGKNHQINEVFPSQSALILQSYNQDIISNDKEWGFPYKGSRIINVRQETVQEKPSFNRSFQNNRCVICTDWFYERDRNRNNVAFYQENEILFLAGFFQKNQFVILTTSPNKTVKPIHPRMPILLKENELQDWFSDNYLSYLQREQEELLVRREMEQLALF